MSSLIKYILVFLLSLLGVLQSVELISALYRNANWMSELTLLIFTLLIILILTNIYFKSKRDPEKPVFRDNKFLSAISKIVLVCTLIIAVVFSYIQYLEAETHKRSAIMLEQELIKCQSKQLVK